MKQWRRLGEETNGLHIHFRPVLHVLEKIAYSKSQRYVITSINSNCMSIRSMWRVRDYCVALVCLPADVCLGSTSVGGSCFPTTSERRFKEPAEVHLYNIAMHIIPLPIVCIIDVQKHIKHIPGHFLVDHVDNVCIIVWMQYGESQKLNWILFHLKMVWINTWRWDKISDTAAGFHYHQNKYIHNRANSLQLVLPGIYLTHFAPT